MKSITPFQPKPGLKPTVRRIAALDDSPHSSFPFDRDSELTFKGDSPVVGELLMLLLESMRQFRAQSGSTNISVAGNTTVIRQNICNIVNNYRAAVSGNMSTELRALLTNIESSFSGGNITSEQTEQLIDGLSVQLSRISSANQSHTANVSELTSILGGNTGTDVTGIIRELKKNAEMTRLREMRSFTGHTDRLFSSFSALEFRVAEKSVSLRDILRESAVTERGSRTAEISTERHFQEKSTETIRQTESRTERSDFSRESTADREKIRTARDIRREISAELRSESARILSGFLRSAGGGVTLHRTLLEEKNTRLSAVSVRQNHVLISDRDIKAEFTREPTDRRSSTAFSRESAVQSLLESTESNRSRKSAETSVSVSEAVRLLTYSQHRAERSQFKVQFVREQNRLLAEKSREISSELLSERTSTRENSVRLRSEITFRSTESGLSAQTEPMTGRYAEAPEPSGSHESAVFHEQERLSVNLSTELRRTEILRELKSSAVTESRFAELRREFSIGKSAFGTVGAVYREIPGERTEILSEMRAAANNSHFAEKISEFFVSDRNNELVYSREYTKDTDSVTENLLRERQSSLRTAVATRIRTESRLRANSGNSPEISRNTALSNETNVQAVMSAGIPPEKTERVFKETAFEVPAYTAFELLNEKSLYTRSDYLYENYSRFINSMKIPGTDERSIVRRHTAKTLELHSDMAYLVRENTESAGLTKSYFTSDSNIELKYTAGNKNDTVLNENSELTNSKITVQPLTLNNISRLLGSKNHTVERLYSSGSAAVRLVEVGSPTPGEISLPGGAVRLGLSELFYAGDSELRETNTLKISRGTEKTELIHPAGAERITSGATGVHGVDGSSANGKDGGPGSAGKAEFYRIARHSGGIRQNTSRELLRKIVASSELSRLYGEKSELRASRKSTTDSRAFYFGSVSSSEFYSGADIFTERVFRTESSENSDRLREILRSQLTAGLTEKTGFTDRREQMEIQRTGIRSTSDRFTVSESPELIIQALGGSSAEILENGGLVLAAVPGRSGARDNSAAGSGQDNSPPESITPAQDANLQSSGALQNGTEIITQKIEKQLRELVQSAVGEITTERRFTEKIQSTLLSRESADRLCGMVMERLESRLRTESRITGR